jgi:hypothetical protein
VNVSAEAWPIQIATARAATAMRARFMP